MSPPSDSLSLSDLFDHLDFFPIALVISATLCPGLTLCIPGLLFVAVLLVIPIVAVLLVIGVVAAVVMAPFALVRGVRRLHRLMAPSPDSVRAARAV
jgi:predicted membrane channel-forming protein YqfA (hemolysin III family)